MCPEELRATVVEDTLLSIDQKVLCGGGGVFELVDFSFKCFHSQGLSPKDFQRIVFKEILSWHSDR